MDRNSIRGREKALDQFGENAMGACSKRVVECGHGGASTWCIRTEANRGGASDPRGDVEGKTWTTGSDHGSTWGRGGVGEEDGGWCDLCEW